MDGSLQAALQAAANAMRGLGNAARQASAAAQASRGGLAGLAAGLNQLQQAAQRYKQVQDALKQTTADMSKASQNLRSAREKYAADTAAVEKLKAKLQERKTAQAELGTKKSAGNASLKQLRQDRGGQTRRRPNENVATGFADKIDAGRNHFATRTNSADGAGVQGIVRPSQTNEDGFVGGTSGTKRVGTRLIFGTGGRSTARGKLQKSAGGTQRAQSVIVGGGLQHVEFRGFRIKTCGGH